MADNIRIGGRPSIFTYLGQAFDNYTGQKRQDEILDRKQQEELARIAAEEEARKNEIVFQSGQNRADSEWATKRAEEKAAIERARMEREINAAFGGGGQPSAPAPAASYQNPTPPMPAQQGQVPVLPGSMLPSSMPAQPPPQAAPTPTAQPAPQAKDRNAQLEDLAKSVVRLNMIGANPQVVMDYANRMERVLQLSPEENQRVTQIFNDLTLGAQGAANHEVNTRNARTNERNAGVNERNVAVTEKGPGLRQQEIDIARAQVSGTAPGGRVDAVTQRKRDGFKGAMVALNKVDEQLEDFIGAVQNGNFGRIYTDGKKLDAIADGVVASIGRAIGEDRFSKEDALRYRKLITTSLGEAAIAPDTAREVAAQARELLREQFVAVHGADALPPEFAGDSTGSIVTAPDGTRWRELPDGTMEQVN